MLKKLLMTLALVAAVAAARQAQAQVYVPKYSNEFLAIGVGARAQGMGNTQVAVANDVTAGYWNPAGLAGIQRRYEAGLMHASYFAGIANYDYAAGAARLDSNSVLAVSFVRLAVDDIADTRYLIVNDVIDYSRIRRFSANDNALFISYARRNMWLQGLDVGGSFKVIYRAAGNFAQAWGFGIDAGLRYRRNGWLLGLVARDITTTYNAWSYNTSELAPVFAQTGNTIPENSVELTLPRLVPGIAHRFNIKDGRFFVMPSVDLEMTFDGKRNVLLGSKAVNVDPRAGMELAWKDIVFLRGGIQNFQRTVDFNNSERLSMQPNFGLGVRIAKVNLDYALTDLGNQSEALYSHIFSLRVSLD